MRCLQEVEAIQLVNYSYVFTIKNYDNIISEIHCKLFLRSESLKNSDQLRVCGLRDVDTAICILALRKKQLSM